MESGASALTPSQSNELHFLRSRVRELERERAELSAENQRLKTMLVHGESGSKQKETIRSLTKVNELVAL